MKGKVQKRFFLLSVALFLVIGFFIVVAYLPKLFPAKTAVFSNIKKEDIQKIRVVVNKKTILIEKTNHNWMTNGFIAEGSRVESLLTTLFDLKKEEIVSQNKNKYSSFGVDGSTQIELGGQIVYIGKPASAVQSYFRVDGDSHVYLASINLIDLLTPDDFRDLNVYFVKNENKVTAVDETWQENAIHLVKKEDDWILNANLKAKKERVDFFINDLKKLQGNDIFLKDTFNTATLSADLTINLTEDAKVKKGTFYRLDENTYYFIQDGPLYVYRISAPSVASLKKEEKDFIE